MPTVNSNTVNLTLNSTYSCKWGDDGHNYVVNGTPPTTDNQTANFNNPVPAGATITAIRLRTTWSYTGGVSIARVNGANLAEGTDVRNVSGWSHTYTWKCVQTCGTYQSQGSYTRTMSVSAYLEVTYTEPKSGLSLSTQHINAGQSLTAYIAPTNSAYWHRLRIQFGFASYSVDIAAGTKSVAYTIPMDWLQQIPSAAYGWGTVFLDTYNGSTLVGTNSLKLYIYAPESVVPTITGFTATLVSNGVDASITRYVQNYSKCLLEITGAAGAYGSTIVGYSITGGGISGSAASGTFGPFNMSGDVVFTAKVTDGRGRTATRQVAIDVMPYTAPAFSSPEAWRSNYDGVKNQKGTYVRLKSGVQYSSLGEQNAVTLKGRVYLKGGTAPAWETMTPDTELILGGGTLLSTRTYIAQIQASDLLESRITEFIIPTKKTGISIMAGLSGAAIGKSAETPGIFESAWPIVAPGMPPNPNILHNWDFRNPVNQRGVSGTISATGYFYDRWILNSGAVTTNDAYLTVGAGAVVEQRIEGNLLAGAVVTVSVMVGGEVYSGTGTMPTSAGTASVTLTGFGTATLGYNSGYMFVRFSADAERDVTSVKVELGTSSTLHLDPPMDHAAELPKCQRFFLDIYGAKPTGIAYNTIYAVLFLPTVCPMRITPTSQAGTIKIYHNGSTATVSIVDIKWFLTGLEIKVQGTFSVNQPVIGEPIVSPHGMSADL